MPAARRYLDGALAVLDHDFVVVAAGDDFAALLGWRPRDLVGVPGHDLVDPAEPTRLRAMRERELRHSGAVTSLATLLVRHGAPVPFAYSVRALNGGELYVARGEPASAVHAELGPDDLLTTAEAVAYSRHSVASLERAVRDNELRVGGTPHRRLYRRAWLDSWLGLALVLVALLALLAALECAGVVDLPRVPIGTSHRPIRPMALHHERDRLEDELAARRGL